MVPPAAGEVRRRLIDKRILWYPLALVLAAGLYLGYLRMSRNAATNSDGASNALQAWDMMHGNVLLRSWTLTDVSFYTTELPEYALVLLVRGLSADVIHVAAALTYTLLVAVCVVLAKGRARGAEAAVRVAVVLAIVLVPGPNTGYLTLLSAPDHTGSGIPVLVTWFVLERALAGPDGERRGRLPRFLPYLLAVLLAWGEIGDPIIGLTAAAPLVVYSALRLARPGIPDPPGWRQRLRGPDGRLLAAGLGGIALTELFLLLIRLAGGYSTHAVSVHLAVPTRWPRNVWITIVGLAVDYGFLPSDRHGAGGFAIGALHLVGLLVALAVTARVSVGLLRAAWRNRPAAAVCDNPVNALLTLGILANVGAFTFSTQPIDQLSARQIVAVLPLGAVLAARVCGPRLAAVRAPRLRIATAAGLAAVLVALAGGFAAQCGAAPPVPASGQAMANWLDAQHQRYGLGSYWTSNVTTLITAGRVHVVPVAGAPAKPEAILAYRWESRADWYDPDRHDARFIIVDLLDPVYGKVSAATRQFGTPVARRDFGRFAVLLYDHNLLVGLPAQCGGGRDAPSMAECAKR